MNSKLQLSYIWTITKEGQLVKEAERDDIASKIFQLVDNAKQ